MACEHEGQEAAVLMDRIIVSSDFSVVTVCVPWEQEQVWDSICEGAPRQEQWGTQMWRVQQVPSDRHKKPL